MKNGYCTAIVLAAGQGKRMGTEVQKQFLELNGKPLVYYSLKAFENSALVNEIILVTSEGVETYCRKEIVEKYGFQKVKTIVTGGKERYHSVWNGLQKARDEGTILIHDGARPFVTEEIIARTCETLEEHRACVVGMPVKDTIKVSDDMGYVVDTPEREYLWMVQTPQGFEAELVKSAYAKLMECTDVKVTDDAQVVELMMYEEVKLVQGSYENIKITTPEDLEIAKIFL